MKRTALWMVTLVAAAALPCRMSPSADAEPLGIYVATDGADGNPGTKAKPVATLGRARDAIRALKQKDGLPPGGVTVWLRGGVYYLRSTFELGKEDSGTESSPVVYRAYGKEKVCLSGGRKIDASHFRPVTDPAVLKRVGEKARGELVQLDMEAVGITDYLRELPDKFTYKAPSHGKKATGSFRGYQLLLEVLCNGKRMPLARWPNKGFARYAKAIAGVRDHRKRELPKVASIQYEGDRPSRWDAGEGVWLRGFWGVAYRCGVVKVGSIDTSKHQIDLAAAPFYGVGPGGGRRFFALNLLDELDAPGEWYLDRQGGTLYFRPPASLEECDIAISMLKSPIVAMRDASFVTIRGLGIECARQNAVYIGGGAHNRIIGCEIRNVGGNAVDVMGGTDHGVIGCDIHHIGSRGVTLMGGDRQTLEPGNHVALNNHIHHTSQLWPTHAGAITLRGVGCRAAHNLIHHDPHVPVWYWGNEHVMEYNEIYQVCTETTESGVFYSYFDWTYGGNLIRHNYVHHVNDTIEGCQSSNPVLHLDGGMAGTSFIGNVCYRVGDGICHNDGPGHTIENNIFVDARRGVAVHLFYLNGWTFERLEDGNVIATRKSDGCRYSLLKAKNWDEVPYDRPPYTKYRHLIGLKERDPICAPWHCVIARNVFLGGYNFLRPPQDARWKEWITVGDTWDEGDPGFVDLAHGDFRLRPDAPVLKMGFKPIPFEKIGLYEDEARASWPVDAEQPPKDWKPRWMRLRDQQDQMFTGRLPVFMVKRVWGDIRIDGVVVAEEWNPSIAHGAPVETHEPARVEWGTDGKRVKYPSTAWVEVDDAHLYVAFVNDVDPAKGVTGGQQWGKDDAVEVALAVMENMKVGHTMVLWGYTNGHFESSAAAGAPQRVVKRVAQGVRYAAKVVGPGQWTAEWQIPFTSLGIDPRKKNPRLLFNLSVRKPAGNIWAMWKKAGGSTFEVKKGGLLWLSPFGNIAFSSYAPSQAWIDIDGMREGVVMEAVAGCRRYPGQWVKPKGSFVRGQTGDLTAEEWKDFEVAFIPEKDGMVSFHIRGRVYQSRTKPEALPVWVYFDDVVVQGAELTNGGFEELNARGFPAGWAYSIHHKPFPYLIKSEGFARTGRHCVKVWYRGKFTQELQVKKGQRVTIKAKVRGEAQQ